MTVAIERYTLPLVIAACFGWLGSSSVCYAIGFENAYGTPGNYLDSSSPWLWTALPDDLLYPEEAILGCQGLGCISGSTAPVQGNVGVAIAPNWLLGTRHNFGAGNMKAAVRIPDPTSPHRGATTVIEYKIAEQIRGENMDLTLIRLEDDQGLPANLPYTPLTDEYSYSLMAATIGSHGGTHLPDAYPLPGPFNPPASGLRWGRLFLEAKNSNRFQKGVIPSYATNLQYPVATLGNGDSGGTYFQRDGWDWRVAGQVTSSAGSAARLHPGSVAREWIESTIGSQFPSQAGSMAPTPDVTWSGVGNASVSAGDLLSVEGDSTISSSATEAQDIFVRSGQTASVTLTQLSSDLILSGSVFLAPEVGNASQHLVSGGSINADSLHVGHAGAGTMLATGTSITAHNAIEVGRESGSSGLLHLINSESYTSNIALGVKLGSAGTVNITDSATVGSNNTFVGRYGQGNFTNSGVHSSDYLSIGEHPGAVGTYHLTNNGSLTTTHTQVGSGGQGTFDLSGGLHTTQSLSVDASSTYSLNGGEVQAESVTINGRLELNGGIFNSESLARLTVAGELEFTPSSGSLSVAGLVDLTEASFIAPSNGTIYFSNSSLGMVSSNTLASMSAAGITASTSGQPLHLVGSTLTIDQNTIIGQGSIADHVIVTTNGASHGEILSEGAAEIAFENGVTKHLGGIIRTGAAFINTSRNGIGQPSYIEAAAGELNTYLFIQGDGHLTAEGDILSPILNQGVLEVASGIGAINLSGDTAIDPHHSMSIQPGSKVILDLTASGSDSISAYTFAFIHDDSVGDRIDTPISGTLQLDTPVADISSLPTLTEISLMGPTAGTWQSQFQVEGVFSEIGFGEAGYEDFYNADRAVAVLYDGEVPGYTGATAVEGISAFVTLPGDFNLDGEVGNADLTILQNNWNTYGATWMTGDANGDGKVGNADLNALLGFWNESLNPSGGNSVPEPGTVGMLLLTIASVSLFRTMRE